MRKAVLCENSAKRPSSAYKFSMHSPIYLPLGISTCPRSSFPPISGWSFNSSSQPCIFKVRPAHLNLDDTHWALGPCLPSGTPGSHLDILYSLFFFNIFSLLHVIGRSEATLQQGSAKTKHYWDFSILHHNMTVTKKKDSLTAEMTLIQAPSFKKKSFICASRKSHEIYRTK